MTFFLEINITGHAVNWRDSDPFFFVFDINFVAILSYACSSDIAILVKVGRKNLWTFEVGHGTKKIEKH